MTRYIGIDPGKTGAIAELHRGKAYVWRMPIVDGYVDLYAVAEILRRDGNTAHVMIENVGLRSKQAGVITMIRNWQTLLDACIVARVPYDIVEPKTWQKGIVTTPKGYDAKKRRAEVMRQYCDYALDKWGKSLLIPKGCRVVQDGIAAALCIAEYNSEVN